MYANILSNMNKPYSESSDQNKEPIAAVLADVFMTPGRVLEIGAGTGQHAVYFASLFKHLVWQATDVPENLPGIHLWTEPANLPNLLPVRSLDVTQQSWDIDPVDYVFSANTAHIMSWPQVEFMFAGVARIMKPGARFALYGPFNYHGQYTSTSNERFDGWLKQRDPLSGIRDIDTLQTLANSVALELVNDYSMPVNNRTLIWEKTDVIRKQ